jgi:hypothetical protein
VWAPRCVHACADPHRDWPGTRVWEYRRPGGAPTVIASVVLRSTWRERLLPDMCHRNDPGDEAFDRFGSETGA